MGAGQWATITAISADGHTLTVNKPWAVLPVNGSRYATFDWSSANWIVAGNTLSDNEKGIEFFSASIRDILVANNTLTNNGEILISPTEQPDGSGLFNLVLNTQITGNTLVDSNHLRPAAISLVSREDDENNNVGTQIIGLEVRGNSITGYIPNTIYTDISLDDAKALSEGFNVYWQWQSSGNFADDGTPSILGTILQGNTLTNSAAGLQTNSAVSQTVLAGNIYNNVGTPIVDTVLPGESHGSVGTTTAPTASPNAAAPLVWQQFTVGSLPASTLTPEPASVTSFSLPTSDYQIGSGPDSLSMLAQQLSGDGTAVARITISPNADAATRGLLVFRADSSATSAFFAFGQSKGGQMIFQYRLNDGGSVAGYTFPYASSPIWVKIVKAGTIFTAYYSGDGVSWKYGGVAGADFIGNYYVGLASLSDSLNEPAIVFDNVSVP
jgi:parallel beta-helix repeat protein